MSRLDDAKPVVRRVQPLVIGHLPGQVDVRAGFKRLEREILARAAQHRDAPYPARPIAVAAHRAAQRSPCVNPFLSLYHSADRM